MFGKNELRKRNGSPAHMAGELLNVQETFYTIQGEGPHAGRPAVFLRLAGCNLRCYFCDTDFESQDTIREVEHLGDEILALWPGTSVVDGAVRPLLVITGGEPLLQNPAPLCLRFIAHYGWDVQIETAGTVWPTGLEEVFDQFPQRISLVCSPKTGSLHRLVIAYCRDYKYIVTASMCINSVYGIPGESTQTRGLAAALWRPPFGHNAQIWVQPRAEYMEGFRKMIIGSPLASDLGRSEPVPNAIANAANVQYAAQLAMKYGYRVSLQQHKLMGLP